ncbi:MAG: hypothetical protein V7606_135 [Burkholderiales bacterium]
MKRRDLLKGAAGATMTGLSGMAFGQSGSMGTASYIKYVVPFAPGGLTDVLARIVAQKLNAMLGISVIVENKSGAHAQIGADFVAKAAGDGNTILAINQAHAVNVSLFPHAPFSLSKDLRTVALLADSPMAIVVPSASSIKTFRDLMAVSKTKPLNASSAGSGSGPHLALELFNDLNGSSITHVPYRGGAPSLTDLISGVVDVSFANYPQALPHIKSGRLRFLANCSEKRHPDFPDVPTARESGMPKLLMENWTGVMVPASTPNDIVDKYSKALVKIVSAPEMAAALQDRGFIVNAKGHKEFDAFLKSEIERWAAVVKKADIKAS